MKTNRRSFVGGSGLALAGVAGTLTGLNSRAQAAQQATSPSFASFGWEVANLDDNGADVFFEVTNSLVLNAADFDIAFMLTSPPAAPGFTEILCRAAVSPGAPPQFYKGDPGASFISPQSPNFGKVKVHNPHGLNVGNDGYLLQNVFCSVILKTWVTADGTASSTSRHVRLAQSLALNAGDYLVFNMSHAGVPGDCEMQVVLEYALS
ncbi:MAG: hypothetical protein WB817_11865 [Terriglobales bacterium]